MKSKRYIWIDLLRSFAIMCVVLCHSVEASYKLLDVNFMNALSLKSEIFSFIAFTFGRTGVPIFLFITGYLILGRNFDSHSTIKFWKKNWLPLLITIEIWLVIYSLLLYITRGTPTSLWGIIKDVLFLDGTGYNHMWYAYMIVGVYLFLPFVSSVVEKFETKIILFPLILSFVYLSIVPLTNILLTLNEKGAIENQLDLNFSGGIYGIYIIIGYLIKKGIFKNIKSSYLVFLSILSFVLTVVLQMYLYGNRYVYPVNYSNCFLIIFGMLIFELGSRIKTIPFEKIWLSISKCSFGIFLIHNPVKDFVISILNFEIKLLPIKTAIIFIITFIISWSIVALVGKIPIVRKYLFNMK